MNGKRFSEDKARRNGFYLALAVCLVAVGIAAWSAYDAIHSYLAPDSTAAASLNELQNQDVRSSEEAGADGADEDPETPDNTSSARKASASAVDRAETSSAQQTPAAKPTAEPAAKPTAAPTAAPTVAPESEAADAEPEEAQIPVNGPIYELSTQMIAPLETEGVLKAYSAGMPMYSETMKDWRIHTGTDFAAEAGEEVRACANGQVKETYTDAMQGNVIMVEHGDYVFSYCGVGENFLVQPGDIVTKGQVIGTVTAVPSESADPPHLHVEVRRDAVWLDPVTVIEGKD